MLKTASGVETTEFELHDSILFEATALSPRTGYTVSILDDNGKLINAIRLSTDDNGVIPETVLWYDIGVSFCSESPKRLPPGAMFLAPDVRDPGFAGRTYTLRIAEKEEVARETAFRIVADSTRPTLYAADARGCPRSGFLVGEENIWVVGRGFPAGCIIRLSAVDADSEWEDGDPLEDRTGQYDDGRSPLLELGPAETGFQRLLWPRGLTSVGSYDIVAEVISYPFGTYHVDPDVQAQNVLANPTHSGFVVQRRPGAMEPLEQDAAGVRMSRLAFRDTFLTSENVFVGVDPYIHPSYMGATADVYIVPHKTESQWVADPSLPDVTGFIETVTIQPGACANCYSTLAWAAPLTLGDYDVVLDFNQDGTYTPMDDLIDSLDAVGFTVSEVRVDTISFRYSGSGALTLYDNAAGSVVDPPEYAVNTVKPAAWVRGGSHSVEVSLKAVPSASSAQIWAEGGLGGLNSASSPVTVSFSGGSGQATLNVNSPPSAIGKREFLWNWKYRNLGGSVTGPMAMGWTGTHLLYTTHAAPQPPMTTPWVDVLEYATTWAGGETTEAAVVEEIVEGIYSSGMVYSGAQHHTSGMTSFDLTSLFNELRTPGLTVYMDCRDCANLFHVLTNALGFNHEYLRIPGQFLYEQLWPMGHSNCNSNWWNYHQVGWCGSEVADASAKLDCPPPLVTAICNITANSYINYLTNTSGITAGSTGTCSPF
jgi:hypothetical protein